MDFLGSIQATTEMRYKTSASAQINELNQSHTNEAMYSRKDGVIFRFTIGLTYDL